MALIGRAANSVGVSPLRLMYGDDMPVPSFGPRLRCEKCGHLGAEVKPNWNERAPQGRAGYNTHLQ